MTEPATDPRAATGTPAPGPGGTDRPTVAELAAAIGTPDIEAGIAARRDPPAGAGRLAALARWLAETQGHWPPKHPRNARLLVFGPADSPGNSVAAVAAARDVAVRTVVVAENGDDDTIGAAFASGVAAADAAVDEGVDLLVIAGADSSAAAGVLVSAFTGAEPIALLPRGAAAIDTEGWIARAAILRNQRRRVVALRHDPDRLLAVAGSPLLAAAAGCVLRATGRRTPIVLDGVTAVSAALLCHEQQPNSARWWQIADGSTDPVHAHAVEDIDRRPVLDLGITRDDGTAGILAVSVLRAAAAIAAGAAEVGAPGD